MFNEEITENLSNCGSIQKSEIIYIVEAIIHSTY